MNEVPIDVRSVNIFSFVILVVEIEDILYDLFINIAGYFLEHMHSVQYRILSFLPLGRAAKVLHKFYDSFSIFQKDEENPASY